MVKVKSFPVLRTTAAGAIALLLLAAGAPGKATADEAGGAAAAAAKAKTTDAAPTPSTKEEEEPPTTVVTPSDEAAEPDTDVDAAKAAADSNHCTQCQIQSDAYRKLKAEADDANENIKKNQELQAKLKPDEDKSAWIKVESNLRMWDIKVESLKKNLDALQAQMKQDCHGCPQVMGAPETTPTSNPPGTQAK